jgi:cellulose synthase/poly-beta-1,6-N-acetylglucosamine synthase-like glycosyltransferase
VVEISFFVAATVIWLTITYFVVLAIAGQRFLKRRPVAGRMDGVFIAPDSTWPGVSVLVPAHNEARVIERSLHRLLALEYPHELLEVLVIDDASSDDTGAICDRVAAEDERVRVLHRSPPEGGRGKSAALNAALECCSHPLVAIYDADNRPRPDALRRLVVELMKSDYTAAVGKIVKVNRRRTFLNRFCAIEFSAFQWIVQAGRALLLDLVFLPGTNFVIRAEAVRELGGWDPHALTEDTELSIRIYQSGHAVAFVPAAVSEEQDPEQLRVWLRQRIRWARGNLYAFRKHSGKLVRPPNRQVFFGLFDLAIHQSVCLAAIVVSDVLFIATLAQALEFDLVGTYGVLWVGAFLVFVAAIQITEALEGHDTWKTPLVAGLMYVSYLQLWLYVAVKSLLSMPSRREFQWEKTPRFQD